jgi:hypothetical protein
MFCLGLMLLLVGEIVTNVRLMAFGLFIFGLGVSPLSVVQETIIVRFFKSHGLGVSMAVGLVAGKATAFVSARTSYPLSERYGIHAPFYVATFLAGLSVTINLVYIWASKRLMRSTVIRIGASEIHEDARHHSLSLSEARALEKVTAKRSVNLGEVTKFDDVFWALVLRYPHKFLIDRVPADIWASTLSAAQYGRLLLSSLRWSTYPIFASCSNCVGR